MNDSSRRWSPYSERDKYPCRKDGVDCTMRHPGCQDTCPDMLAAKIVNGSRKAIERKKRLDNVAVDEVKQKGVLAAKRMKKPER